MTQSVAIVGMACRYPDAASPSELWENVLAGRRAFRRIPPERLRLEDYFSADRETPDCVYSSEAAVIEGYEFDRVRFRVAGNTYRAADLAHWLALDTAAGAVADAGYGDGAALPRETSGVFLGNTLTGEFSRAQVMRLRWPYVRRVVEASLAAEGWEPARRREFVEKMEPSYKEPFAPVGEESLAGSLSNTIAGRICNHFDLKGGGYTVDGACASSLLAVVNACTALAVGDLDVALAGGVDLSLDPFELVGFAKTGALAPERMRVYDRRSKGFWPGEGCGFVTLMRLEDALAERRAVYAVIRGWGVSSDGSGGITRPEEDGQLLALERAYRRAGFGAETVAYFEGHGTGTSVGDATELRALARARRAAANGDGPGGRPAAVGSVKANIGHTKAAAGVAGLIKATMALRRQVLPPTTGCEDPHPELTGESPALRVLSRGELWPDAPLRAGVSSFGFGGINTHVVLEGRAASRRTVLGSRERALLSSAWDAEVLLFGARDGEGLRAQVERLSSYAARLSAAEVADVAAQLSAGLGEEAHEVRAAVVASSPAELAARLELLKSLLEAGTESHLDAEAGVFLGRGQEGPRVGFLFPGQGSPTPTDGGAWRGHFAEVSELYERAPAFAAGDARSTATAQPAIATASAAGLRVLRRFGVTASVGVGHSLGELVALHWAGAVGEAELLEMARVRGRAMGCLNGTAGAMAGIGAGGRVVAELTRGTPAVIAGYNSPSQTVVSGAASAVSEVVGRARQRGLKAVGLPVSHAFHSPLVAAAEPAFAEHLSGVDFRPLGRDVVSTVTGGALAPDADLRSVLRQQITRPVLFTEAVEAAGGVDFWIEVGPGQVLRGLLKEFAASPVVSLDACGASVKGLCLALGAAFAAGAGLDHRALFSDRFTKPFDLDWRPRFFANPCESAPVSADAEGPARAATRAPSAEAKANGAGENSSPPSAGQEPAPAAAPLELLRQLVAERAELPLSAVRDEHRLLSDLHLNSITVGQIVDEVARRAGLTPSAAPTEYADATLAEAARALEELARNGGGAAAPEESQFPPGVDTWLRAFTTELVESPLPQRRAPAGRGPWRVLAPPGHPLLEPLREAFGGGAAGRGVVVCLPPSPDESHVRLLLEGARAALSEPGATHFVLVQQRGGAAGFARTLHLEAHGLNTCVVSVPLEDPRAAGWVLAEAAAANGYSEAHYDAAGVRREPFLKPLPDAEASGGAPLTADDVLLVTGGGKGIAAECALSLARRSGARLALLGRSRPEGDAELSANLERFRAAGISFEYLPTDITDAAAVGAAVRAAEESLGSVTAVLHGAGANTPRLIPSLDEEAVRDTLRPKVDGLRHVLAALRPERLRLLVTFGSIIARTGMRGEADYALANEWLARLTEEWQASHPGCRCLALEWSVWSGVGMGERLGRIEALAREGVTPIPPDAGVRALHELLSRPLPAASVVVAGRFGAPPTLKLKGADLPFRRFLERPRVFYPGVELIADAVLSPDSDPYLEDHVWRGERLLPAVMGLEAMAQAATALLETDEPPVFEDVQFTRPILVAPGEPLTLRVAALQTRPGEVEVVLRSERTSFQVDHFRARCRARSLAPDEAPASLPSDEESLVALEPEAELYGGLLFHEGRFRRLRGYRRLKATECVALIAAAEETEWFGRYLPSGLVLGDPAARDTAIHAVQACIPHATLLPSGVARLAPGPGRADGPGFARAREVAREGDTFVYDVEVRDAEGRVRELWEGLRLRRVSPTPRPAAWPEPLLGPYVERMVSELIPGSDVRVAVERDAGGQRREAGDRAVRAALGRGCDVRRRPDGKPVVESDEEVSMSHAAGLTLGVADGGGPLGCDMERVEERGDTVWRDLLGSERFKLAELISHESGEGGQVAATRVWAAAECLKKAGAMLDAPLMLAGPPRDGWVLLRAGALSVATLAESVRGVEGKLVLAVLARGHGAEGGRDAGL